MVYGHIDYTYTYTSFGPSCCLHLAGGGGGGRGLAHKTNPIFQLEYYVFLSTHFNFSIFQFFVLLSVAIQLISDYIGSHKYTHIPYPRKRGPMGGAPYIGPRFGDGPIFKVSVLCLYTRKSTQVSYPR